MKFKEIILIVMIPFLVYSLSFSTIVFNEDFYIKHAGEKSLEVLYFLKDAGVLSERFNAKEKAHLEDVRKVIHFWKIVFMVCLVAFIVLVNYWSVNSSKVFFYGGLLGFVPLILALIPFETIFSAFHYLVFAQGSWTFSPSSYLIGLFPLGFFKAGSGHLLVFGLVLSLFFTVFAKCLAQENC